MAVIAIGAALAYVDHQLGLHTMLVEVVHALVVTGLFIACLRLQRRTPEISQFGWRMAVIGLGLLAMGSWVDLLDDPPTLALFQLHGVPFGRSWEQAFLKKILGYTVGISLLAIGLIQWAPWMIRTRRNVHDLNRELSHLLMSLDERVEAERLALSRELHDDLAQRLTFLGYQAQFCQKTMGDTPELKQIGQDISDALKTVRRLSRDLRPESLDSLGFLPALEQFIEKQRRLSPEMTFTLDWRPCEPGALDNRLDDHARLHLFRMIQEAVRNAVKHSGGAHIAIALRQADDGFYLTIADDGAGFPWREPPCDDALLGDGHLGLVGLQERARELGASVRLLSAETALASERGARVELRLPKGPSTAATGKSHG
ncbi:MAG: sensor histidine kinase [Vampirovibrionales bacterium]|nr:sensor histidine kinase [Vampirovibrionales bacterium]